MMTVEVVRAGSGKPKALSVNCIGALALSGRLTSAKVSFRGGRVEVTVGCWEVFDCSAVTPASV